MLCNDGACDVAGLLNEVDCAVEGGLEDDDDGEEEDENDGDGNDGSDDNNDDDDDDDDDDEEEEEADEEEEEEEEEEEDDEGVCSGDVVHLTNKTFHANVAAAPLALVDFFANWCHFHQPPQSFLF